MAPQTHWKGQDLQKDLQKTLKLAKWWVLCCFNLSSAASLKFRIKQAKICGNFSLSFSLCPSLKDTLMIPPHTLFKVCKIPYLLSCWSERNKVYLMALFNSNQDEWMLFILLLSIIMFWRTVSLQFAVSFENLFYLNILYSGSKLSPYETQWVGGGANFWIAQWWIKKKKPFQT